MEHQINCAKVYRKEVHRPHKWIFQPEDDSPAVIDAICFGFSDGSWCLNFVPF